ncbi:glycoside hydrolase family 53 protein [Flavobacterium wongokense]|uniref:glycoside hydrolase family 53 protein n=1 Tax=Flavobacterium wongokense TaxID=2910674 RepID=UPI001F45FCD4|nr:glycosyl hydrolase 53 family protein [Flavobacterium sp. WG47]MCF6130957.1 arabinogalactan endo-1,4-beta-galactosidase [Flavobacterium sp. WG47]
MKKFLFLLLTVCLFSCSSDNGTNPPIEEEFIRAADMSYLPLIESEGTVYKHNNIAENAITTLKNAGCNTIRIRLWKNPSDAHSGLTEVKTFAQRVKAAGLKVWLTVHYSDTWADPGNQTKPMAWQSMDFNTLKTCVTDYTNEIMTEINPDIIQIGNETNDGMLWPEGKLSTNENQYLQLVTAATTAVRSKSTTTKIMLHFAGISGSDWFFSKVANIDYDYIGLSYYPIWHGKNLTDLQNTMNNLGQLYNKKVLIAETAYPFTLNWNDYTNNIVGLDNQIIAAYPATNDGQKQYLLAIKNLVKQSAHGIGFCYWGSEWVAFRGPTSTNGSSWENQALWDFTNNSLPAMEAFNE